MVTIETISIVFTGISISLAAYYYINTLRNTQRNQELALKAQEQALETRQVQMFMNLYQQTFQPSFISAWRSFMGMEWSNYEEFNAMGSDSAMAMWQVSVFFEGLGVIVKENVLHIRLVAELLLEMTRYYWEKMMPVIEMGRKVGEGRPYWYRGSEYLYNELMKYQEEHPELKT